ncbi:DUF981 family protein [Paenibacillus alvei]|uniref:DUF981 family protein n=1 Tax=Paenibacillus alvei TaxID=44250 RepID=A0A383RCM1_PAEAL|nr:DUF981 family protein [Paenibacillus alvei]SYX84244.1 conserved membrane protein of unknown function [Paenibacillus alvei]
MHIDWSSTQMYNTLMSIATGIGLLQMVRFGWLLRRGRQVSLEGWAIGFAVSGFILTLLGGVMTLTWPLSKVGFPFDDIIFGEPSLAFGVMLLAGAVILWRMSNKISKNEQLSKDFKKDSKVILEQTVEMARPLSYFASAMGLALISIAIAGVYFQLFAAPPEEPISGQFADYPMLEASFISGLYALTGIGAILLPFSLANRESFAVKIMSTVWTITGVAFTLFGALNYFTHIGLIVNTMK